MEKVTVMKPKLIVHKTHETEFQLYVEGQLWSDEQSNTSFRVSRIPVDDKEVLDIARDFKTVSYYAVLRIHKIIEQTVVKDRQL